MNSVANRTLRPSTERRPLRMHSLSPVPSTMTSYSSSIPQRPRKMSGVEQRKKKDGRDDEKRKSGTRHGNAVGTVKRGRTAATR
ncbi:hypothetical protein BHM03_00001135 [Ensete ventricosum]|nr:hypothetical protein BHM03_00001135 [Ensete ventricosum]